MKRLIAFPVLAALLAGCTYSPAEFYGIRQAVPDPQSTKHAGARTVLPVATTSRDHAAGAAGQ